MTLNLTLTAISLAVGVVNAVYSHRKHFERAWRAFVRYMKADGTNPKRALSRLDYEAQADEFRAEVGR